MNLSKGTFPKFIKLCVYSGIFTVISFVCFSTVYYLTNPEVETFTRFLKSNALWNWVQFNILNTESLMTLLAVLVSTTLASAVGYVSAIFAKAFHDEAKEVIKLDIRN